MNKRIALAQTEHPKDMDVIKLVNEWSKQACDAGADLVVFPESLMTRYEEEQNDFLQAAQSIDGPFCTAINECALHNNMWIYYTANIASEGALPLNTAILVTDEGKVANVYHKVHLFDSDTTTESSRMSAGSELPHCVDTPVGRLGWGICYDLRFPELTRTQALDGAQVIIFSAAWVDGPEKVHQWKTLLAARAIENGIYAIGVSRCDEGYIGSSCAFDPYGAEIASAGTTPELLVVDIDLDLVEKAQTAIPSLKNRRADLY